MVTQISDSYKEYKKRKETHEFKKVKIGGLMTLALSIILTPVILYTQKNGVWYEATLVSTLISLILSSMFSGIINDFNIIDKIPDTDDFVYSFLKQKYKECIWLNHTIHFKHEEKFYKVEQISEVDGILRVVSKETSPFHVDEIK